MIWLRIHHRVKRIDHRSMLLAFLSFLTFNWIVFLDYTQTRVEESVFGYVCLLLVVFGLAASSAMHSEHWQHLWQQVDRLNPTYLAGNILVAAIVIQPFEAVSCRRMVFCVLVVPTSLAVLQCLWRAWRGAQDPPTKVAMSFLLITWLACILPGFYVPPFYDGIAGWTAAPDLNKPVRLSGIKLLRDDGETIWFSNGVINPVNFMWRADSQARQRGDSDYQDLLAFFWRAYEQRFPIFEQGRMPNQALLGQFAYPGHNPYRYMPYRDFPPERVVEMVRLSETYERGTNNLLDRRVVFSFDPVAGTMQRGSARLPNMLDGQVQ